MSYNQTPIQTINGQTIVPTLLAAPQANTTGNITASAQSITATDLTGIGSVTVKISGTHAGINLIFEALADGSSDWFPIQGINQSTNALTTAGATGVIATNATVVWTVSPLLGQSQFRVRSTAYTSGTGAIVIHPSVQFVALPVASQAVTAAQTGTWTVQPGNTANTTAWLVREVNAPTATVTQVTPATSSTVLKASNTARKALVLYNGGTSDCYVNYGGTASSSTFTFLLPSLGTTTIRGDEFSGAVNGIWVATGGNAMQVTEVV